MVGQPVMTEAVKPRGDVEVLAVYPGNRDDLPSILAGRLRTSGPDVTPHGAGVTPGGHRGS